MSTYHIRNLRWLLRMAYEGNGPLVEREWPIARGLSNGDWCGELLWEIEQYMIDNCVNPDLTNDSSHKWPLVGWCNGISTEEYQKRLGARPTKTKQSAYAVTESLKWDLP